MKQQWKQEERISRKEKRQSIKSQMVNVIDAFGDRHRVGVRGARRGAASPESTTSHTTSGPEFCLSVCVETINCDAADVTAIY